MKIQSFIFIVGLSCACAQNLLELMDSAGTFSTFLELINTADFNSTFTEEGPYTVFAPTNEALEKLDQDLFDSLLLEPTVLKSVLRYHIIPGKVFSTDLTNDMTPETLDGSSLRINLYKTAATVNGAKISVVDYEATNGVIHAIDDEIMAPAGDVIAVLENDEKNRFTTLLSAISESGLTTTLQGGGPFTIFAPTNEAFDNLEVGTLDGWLADLDSLTTVLLRHVVPGTAYSSGVCWSNFRTANGMPLRTGRYKGDKIVVATKADRAIITESDLAATNGVVHVIDTVI